MSQIAGVGTQGQQQQQAWRKAYTKAVTGAVTHGGLIQLTVTAHGLKDNQFVNVANVGGVPNATGLWRVTVIGANTIDLQGTTFAGAYTSGGTVTREGSG